ncbi:cytochrome P450 2J4-like [Haliotis cracherodii]|uniref:cytochrome P450 2J4-like n=1 Tax=Haliotis cracherodii TaxID=6455 RepID=UPI0039E82CDA
MALLLGMDLPTVLVFLIVFCIAYYVISKPKNLPPGPPVIPFLGNLDFLIKGNRMEQFIRYHKQYGKVFRMYVGGYLVVVLSGFDVVRDAFVTQADCFSHRPNFMWWVSQIKAGIFMSSGQAWKDLRRFSLQTMRDFGMGKSSVEDKVKDEVNAILTILSESDGKRFHFHDFMDVATGNIICSLIFGERYDYHDEKFHELMRLLNDVVKSPGSLNPYYAIPLLRMLPSTQQKARVSLGHMKRLCEFVKGVVQEHEQSYDPNNIRDFVDLYIQMRDGEGQTNKAYSLENFLRLIVDLFLAGTETSSTSVNWALLYMMKYPDIQKKCQEEIDNNIGRGRMITFSDRANLAYVEATINEVLRLSPVVPFFIPHSTNADTTLAGYNIPNETIVLVNVLSVHKDPKYWDDVDEFKPERFLDEKGKLKKIDAFIPFSIGPRVCAGETLARMEVLMYFANMLQNFTFRKPEGATLNFKGFIGATYFPLPYELIAEKR